MQIKIFMESPAGDVKEVVVNDPNKDLVPLMVAGWHQVRLQEPVGHESVAQGNRKSRRKRKSEMANLNELLIGLGYAVQASISTAPTTPGYWRLPNLNKKPWSQKVVNDETGRKSARAMSSRPSSGSRITTTARTPSSARFGEILAHALGFGLGSVVVTGSAAPYTYTITPINPATNSTGLELPYSSSYSRSVPAARRFWINSSRLRHERLEARHQAGSGTPECGRHRRSGAQRALHDAERRHHARTDDLARNAVAQPHADDQRCRLRGQQELRLARHGMGQQLPARILPRCHAPDGYATQGRFEIGDRMATFTYVARYQHGSTELATLLALTTGTAVVGLTYGSNDTFTGTWQQMAFKVVEIGDVDGIVTVSVTGEPMYNSTNGIFSAVILSTTGHICQ